MPLAGFAFDPAATPAQRQIGAFPTFFRQSPLARVVFSISEAAEEFAVPNDIPGIAQHVPGADVVRLAGKDIAIGFDADRIFTGVASFRPDLKFDRRHPAVFGRRVPKKAHPLARGVIANSNEQRRHFRGRGIQVNDIRNIDEEDAPSSGFDPQVNAPSPAGKLDLIM